MSEISLIGDDWRRFEVPSLMAYRHKVVALLLPIYAAIHRTGVPALIFALVMDVMALSAQREAHHLELMRSLKLQNRPRNESMGEDRDEKRLC